MAKMTWLDNIAGALAIFGGINWGLVGIANFNLVTTFSPSIANVIYSIIGIASVYFVFRLWKLKLIKLY